MEEFDHEEIHKPQKLDLLTRLLTVWVLLAMALGTLIGALWPVVAQWLGKVTIAQISIPVAVFIWVMIFPMMLRVDFASLRVIIKNPTGLILTTLVNWLITPVSMFALALLFFKVFFSSTLSSEERDQFVAGAVMLGGSPCTAMVFVWSHLINGDPTYTLVQVAVNDLILLVAYAPIVVLLLDVSNISLPWDTVLLSVGLFVIIPFAMGFFARLILAHKYGQNWIEEVFLERIKLAPFIALLLTVFIIFIFQGETIIKRPLHILIALPPLTIQTYALFGLTYFLAWLLRIPHAIGAPAAFIAASNFFELAVAVALASFGPESPAVLVTIVGVLEEVPVMLSLVWIAKRTKPWYERQGKFCSC